MEQTASRQTLETLKGIVIEVTKIGISPSEIRDDANLFDDCGLDSTSILELVLAIEERFGITIDEEDLEAELFQNISNLGNFIDRKSVLSETTVVAESGDISSDLVTSPSLDRTEGV